jgi:hypothetical protein
MIPHRNDQAPIKLPGVLLPLRPISPIISSRQFFRASHLALTLSATLPNSQKICSFTSPKGTYHCPHRYARGATNGNQAFDLAGPSGDPIMPSGLL